MNKEEFLKLFLTNTDETGRFIVKSKRTGKTYVVEPIGTGRPADWGDQTPGAKPGEMTGDYGDKYRGDIREEDSLITPENGCENIELLDAGVSPYGEIMRRDDEYYRLMINEQSE